MSDNLLADQVWRSLSALVLDNKDGWRRAVVDEPACRSAGFASSSDWPGSP